jgi:acetyl-CoA carboxylase biotin carboxyl carrier protein
MTFKEIQDLIKLLDKSSLTEFSYKTEEYEIKIKGQQSGQQFVTTVPTPMSTPQFVAAPVANGSSSTDAPKQDKSAESSSAKQETSANLIEIKSPMVGTFYRSSSPDKPAFVNVGDVIQKGAPVCIIEAMKLFNEIESEVSGKIVKVLVEDASPVEYDQVLFLVEA